MSPSGAEFIRQIKSQIDEVDPAQVHEELGNGAVVVDVRETEEVARARSPAPSTCRAATSSRASRARPPTARSA